MKLDILAVGAHPDDVELGCGGTLAKAVAQGKKVGILDLSLGEMGTRGSVEIRQSEAASAAKILGVSVRENLRFEDAFIFNDKKHQLAVVQVLRKYTPDIVLCNAVSDRHIDHARASQLVSHSSFLSGLARLETFDASGQPQQAFRPRQIFHYIQWEDLRPDVVVNISGFLDQKMKAIKAFKSQFYDPESSEPQTPISSLNFLEGIASRAKNMGRLIFTEAGEGFTTERLMGIENFDSLL